MKLLLFNPHLDAEHQLIRDLWAQGHVVLHTPESSEAWQLLQLHGDSVDAIVSHREGLEKDPQAGLAFAQRVRRDPKYASIPMILTTQAWSDADCAKHQATPEGFNAYLQWPIQSGQLQQVLGSLYPALATQETPVQRVAAPPRPPSPPASNPGGIVLEEIGAPPPGAPGIPQIQLELPDAPPSPPSAVEAMPPMVSLGGIEIPTQAGMQIPAELLQSSQMAHEEPLQAESSLSLDLQQATGTDLSAGAPESVDLSAMLTADQASQPQAGAPVPSPGDAEAQAEMPYVFDSPKGGAEAPESALAFVQPVGDAIVPGGASQSPDTETLKKYLLLREQDVAVLSNQLRATREQIGVLEQSVRQEKSKNVELTHVVAEHTRTIEEFEEKKKSELANLQAQTEEMRYELRAKSDKAKILESQVRTAQGEIEKIKERVRVDIRKIRVRERELENKLEITKRDSDALVGAREGKIIELKRRLDLLEFNMDLLQDQLQKERETAAELRGKLAKAAQVVRVAGGLLDPPAGEATAIDDQGQDPDSREERRAV